MKNYIKKLFQTLFLRQGKKRQINTKKEHHHTDYDDDYPLDMRLQKMR